MDDPLAELGLPTRMVQAIADTLFPGHRGGTLSLRLAGNAEERVTIRSAGQQPNPKSGVFLTKLEVARLLGVSTGTVSRYVGEGILPPPSIELPNFVRWRRAVISDWLRGEEKRSFRGRGRRPPSWPFF